MERSTHYITADELFDGIADIARHAAVPTAAHNRQLHRLLELTCTEGLRDTNYRFGNLSSEVDALCKKHQVKTTDRMAIQRMRRDSNASRPLASDDLLYDCRALSLFVSAVFKTGIPSTVVALIPATNRPPADYQHVDYRYVRCTVEKWDDETITVSIDHDDDSGRRTVDYLHTPDYIDLTYLRAILHEGMQLNLLNCTVSDGRLVPQLVVVEPDYLIDISLLAACFEDYGHHPLQYVLNRLKAKANTRHTLLGNLAGDLLDGVINETADHSDEGHRPTTTEMLKDTLRRNYREKALEYATCEDFDAREFKAEASRQSANIMQAVDEIFRRDYQRDDALLEPSFVSERLGLQGRVDLMTRDMRLLVEQKAGRNIFIERHSRNRHGSIIQEKHYVQALLYYGMMEYNFGKSRQRTDIRLLYSRYAASEGMIGVEYLQKLFREAIRLRNLIVAQEYDIAINGFEPYLDRLQPDVLNTDGMDDFFYRQYLLPQIMAVTTPLQQLTAVERSYFCRMMTFVAREQLLAKVGTAGAPGGCAADLWNMPLQEKMETGNIIPALTVVKKMRTQPDAGYDLITLSLAQQLPTLNFRRGDMVILYAYKPEEEPDARRSILFKGTLADITPDEVVVHLTDAQQNPTLFLAEKAKEECYAIEHAGSDAMSTAAIGNLFRWATAAADRRGLLLGQRAPQGDGTRTLSQSYHPAYDDIVLRAKQADDFFLLIGPPGTGKTSMALQYLVRELGPGLLLTAYTNRAVDEICGMLTANGMDYLRLGNRYSCDPLYRDHLISETVDDYPQLTALQERLRQVPIVCATTATLSSRPFLFAIKAFSTIIVDEASQILEPNIIGLLCQQPVGAPDGMRYPRFILIGDHKQLPAVVQQSEEESAVVDPLLRAVGIENCRQSLFERLLRQERQAGRTAFVGTLNRHGRMHPDIAYWPSHMFYSREKLQPVPLPHQQEPSPQPRLRFIAVVPDPEDEALLRGGENTNMAEARIVAQQLKTVYERYGASFSPQQTVGVIVPYRNQIAAIRQEVARLGIDSLNDVSIDTVERYQGSQREVIIYSFTVTRRYQLDFLTANTFVEDGHPIDRKLNVALTRARRQLILVGHEPTLRQSPLFANLIDYAAACREHCQMPPGNDLAEKE